MTSSEPASNESDPTLVDLISSVQSYVDYEMEHAPREINISPEVLNDIATLNAEASSAPPEPAMATSKTSSNDPETQLAEIASTVSTCTKCPLHTGRTNSVPGEGNPRPDILFVGEGPGADEDEQGRPFVGRSGQLLTKMINAMGYEREEIHIANIVKCRPPNNRAPTPEEMLTCLPYLKQQIAILQPKVIVALGATAVKALLNEKTGISKLRGNWHSFEDTPLMPTFHPAYLLRDPHKKKDCWDDLKAVLKHLGKPVPKT